MKKMLLIIASMFALASCYHSNKPPYTLAQYDSLGIELLKERDSVLRKMIYTDKVPDSVAFQKGVYYKKKFAVLFEEKWKYYGKNN